MNDDTKQCFHGYRPTLPSLFSADKSCVLPEGWISFYYEPGEEQGKGQFVGHAKGKRDSDNRRLTECPDDYTSLSKEAIKKICSWEELRPVALGDGGGTSEQGGDPSDNSYSSSKGFGCFGGY